MDIQGLLEKFPIEQHEQINKMRIRAQELETLADFHGSEVGKFVDEYMSLLIKGIESQLLSENSLEKNERDILLEKRRIYSLFKSIFSSASTRLEGIERYADEQMKS